MKQGKFIVLEGSDGSGKTTVSRLLQERMKQAQIAFLWTREPGGTLISEKIRDIILEETNPEMSYRCEALLYAAARADHVERVIRPALRDGRWVLCDRYVLSSLVYQGIGRKLGVEAVRRINDFAIDGCIPDVTLYLDVDPLRVLERKAKVAQQDRLEQAGHTFHREVYEGYQQLLPKWQNVKKIDAGKEISDVVDQAWRYIQQLWEEQP